MCIRTCVYAVDCQIMLFPNNRQSPNIARDAVRREIQRMVQNLPLSLTIIRSQRRRCMIIYKILVRG